MQRLDVSFHALAQLNLSVHDVATYASDHGWQEAPHKNKNFWVFEGPNDDYNNPILLILPRHDNFVDTPLRLAEAITLLAHVDNCSIDVVVENLKKDSYLSKS